MVLPNQLLPQGGTGKIMTLTYLGTTPEVATLNSGNDGNDFTMDHHESTGTAL
jgi:hypothetical protein